MANISKIQLLDGNVYNIKEKIENATAGNFAGLDANGNLTDSGKKASDFLTEHQDISGKLDKAQGSENAGKFMKVGADGNLVPDNVPDPSSKADKVTNATAGNFAGLDASGNLTDSGKSAEDFAGAIYKTATPGSIVTIEDGADDLPVKELKVAIDPVQDLHGYDAPWPAGGGKNLAKITDNTIVRNGVTITFANDEIRLNGTCTGNTWLNPTQSITLPAGTYTMSVEITGVTGTGNRGAYGINNDAIGYLYVPNDGTKRTKTFTLESELTAWCDGYIYADNVYNNAQIKFQIEAGSTSTAYVPYSNICPITGRTGAKVTRTGKNLLNISPITLSAEGNWANKKELDKPIPAGIYTFAVTTSAQSAWTVSFLDENGDRVGKGASATNIQGRQSVTITLTGTATKIGGYLNAPATMSDFQLELGSTATAYEPYQGETYDITFPSEAGTVYGGTLDVTTGVLTVDRAEVDLGTLNWSVATDKVRRFGATFPSNAKYVNGYIALNAISSEYKSVPFSTLYTEDSPSGIFAAFSATRMAFRNDNFSDAASFKSAMSGVQLCYELATPITYQLTAPQVRTLLGLNNIWADTGDITELIYPVNTDTAMALYEKADKVTNATAGNFAALDAEGNLTDSGKKPGDFLTEHQDISGKLDKDQGSANAGKFMKVGSDGNLVPDNVPDPSNKADKVQNATSGNFAGLDANGNLTDSGKSADDFLDKKCESGWKAKTWSGETNFSGDAIWTDGNNIYWSSMYVLDKSTSTWTTKIWSGLSGFGGEYIWTDGENIYLSYGSDQYVLDKSTSTWSTKTWTGLSSFYGNNIWTDGENIYYSYGYGQFVLNKSTSTWSNKTWSGLTIIVGNNIWTDGDNIYYSSGSNQYVLDKSTSTWNTKTWNKNIDSVNVWTDGENTYYSKSSSKQYVLDKSTSTWNTKTWTGFTDIYGQYIWTDGENIYYSFNGNNYVLDNKPKLYLGHDGEFSPVPVKKFIDENVPAPDLSGKVDKNQGTENAGKFMKVGADGKLVPDTVPDPTNKADKVQNATNGNFAGLDANGNLTDSGKKPSDFLTQHQDISGKADKVSGATNGNFAGLDANGNLTDSGKSADDFLDKKYESGWKAKTWSGLTNFNSYYIWSDEDDIYYSLNSDQYVLDKSTSTWNTKTWNGLMSRPGGPQIWTDGENIYYSDGLNHYVLDKSTSTWNTKTWNGFTNVNGVYIWTDGENIYYSFNGTNYVLDKSTSTWSEKSWNGLNNFYGSKVWTDGENVYYSYDNHSYILDKSTSTWNAKSWNGFTWVDGDSIWTDGENIYYSDDSDQYVLDKSTSTWNVMTWTGLTDFDGTYIWTDEENIYYSSGSDQYILDNKPKLYLGQDGEFAPVPVKKFIDENVPAYSFAYDTANSALVITIPN